MQRTFPLTAPRPAPITRAALWIMLSGLCSVTMNVLIRIAADAMHPFEVAFFRCLFGLLFLFPWVVRNGPSLWRSRRVGFYVFRAGIGLVSMLTWFYGITVVPLATATAVNFTAPLFATLAAAFDFARRRQIPPLERGGGRFYRGSRDHAARHPRGRCELADPTAFGGDCSDEQHHRQISRTHRASEHDRRLLYDLSYPSVPDPSLVRLAVAGFIDFQRALVGLGCLGTIAHISVARALAAADASACAPFEFARLPYAALIGFLYFGEVTDLWTWTGAAIIAGSSVYVVYREAHLTRLARRGHPRGRALLKR